MLGLMLDQRLAMILLYEQATCNITWQSVDAFDS